LSRIVAIVVAIALGGAAGVVLAMSSLIDVHKVLGPRLVWFEPYFRLGGLALGGLILAAAFLVVGFGFGRWRRPVPAHHRSDEVRW
jgi:hypothetical protein